MLEINNVSKTYITGNFKQQALKDVSINFRENEFVSILGPSGSGKTTLLNIIGGLDKYTSGDLIINGKSTKKYSERDWDTYRNHRIGFVFQNYNLIPHQTILSNVELALTLSGVSKKERNKKAIEVLKDVGLEEHMYKKPYELSGGQMQRVAIARALVNDPDILLADEPTGALDSKTSVQIMDILKKVSKNKLIIMVTHNADLAKEYSSRIIELKDGVIISDSNPSKNKKEKANNQKEKKTKMSFFTALSLSFNNLMTKKGRTILVAFAGSIGIIGIALILALSTGFQNYIDKLQEDTLTSYPLTITSETADITSMLLSMTSSNGKNDNTETVTEKQYISDMLTNIKANDLKSFKLYLEKNYKKVKKDISNIKYSYSIDPLIYTKNYDNKITKINPNNMFSSLYGSSAMSMYSSYSSVFNQMIDDEKLLKDNYEVLKGRWPKKYDEMIIVLSEPNTISDLLVYSLGLKDSEELGKLISAVMSGETVTEKSDPIALTYDDLMNIDLKLIIPTETYKYNNKYNIYENMQEDETYMKDLYNKSTKIKIVGIVCAKKGSNSMALNPGVAYTSELIKYINSQTKNAEIVKKQLKNQDVDVFSNTSFDNKNKKMDLDFASLISVDNKMLQSAFNFTVSEEEITNITTDYINEISKDITTNITPAKNKLVETYKTLEEKLFSNITEQISENEVADKTNQILNENISLLEVLEKEYYLPLDKLQNSYKGLLSGLLVAYIDAYYLYDKSLTTDESNKVATIDNDIKNAVINTYNEDAYIVGTFETMANYLTEIKMKKEVLSNVSELVGKVTTKIATAFNVDEKKIAGAFKFNLTEEELSRIMSAMGNNTTTTYLSNLISLGYQDEDEPTSISIYFNSFESKENFLKFLDDYNDDMKKSNNEDKEIKYTDTTGLLMGSVKTIVNSVSYVLIAFVSISLVVSSIMIGIITYISVYERTKEIGILRSIGASKHNISSIFNAETFIIGLLSGFIGIGVTYSLIPLINYLIHTLTDNYNINATLELKSAIILVLLAIILTIIGGLIPAKKASKKNPVEALRTE